MKKVSKYYNNKATVCADQNCVTVYGKTAEIVNAVVVTAVVISAVALISKLLK